MPSSTPTSHANNPSHPTFIGLHDEYCFTPSWLTPNKNGYFSLHISEIRSNEHAHRLVVRILLDPLIEGDMVLHRCGNSSCINPSHLYVGGTEENQRDKILHKMAKINSKQIELSSPVDGLRVHLSKPLILSREESRITKKFSGFSPEHCFFDNWLHSTHDGFRQAWNTSVSGEIAGAHRKIYTIFNEPLTRYDILKHTCNNKNCLNPYHLYISDKADQQDFDIKHDKRFKITKSGHELITDYRKSAKEVALELNIHPQTVIALRANQRSHSKLLNVRSS